MPRVLYQFPISHYCEKARWALDHKALAYRVHNQLPGPHAWTNLRRAGKRTVPLLVDDGRVVSGSHAIALYADAQPGGRRLVPASPAAREELEALARYFDAEVAPAVRRYAYRFITSRIGLFRELFFREYHGAARRFGRVMARPIARMIAGAYAVQHPSANRAPDAIRAGADRIDELLRDGRRHLVGDAFSLADITVASLLGPLIGPPGSPWTFELEIPELQTLRDELRARPVGRYITDQYTLRSPPARD